jgi:DNA repair protein RadA/Sms
LQEFRVAASKGPSSRHSFAAEASGHLQKLGTVALDEAPRFTSGLDEFDRVLGGGFVPAGVVVLGGDPGIGKSTLLLQAISHVSSARPVLYITGEESPQQVASRALRLGLDVEQVSLLSEVRLEPILSTLEREKPQLVVVDSIQTLYTDTLTSAPGSVSQVRECAAQLTRLAKSAGISMVLVGHVTKEGTLAGPRVLEHMVDTVLYFEGDTDSPHRLVRAIKNRYGAVNELGIFAMLEHGLREVTNPSALFLSHSEKPVPGSCITLTLEGTRPLAVEVQALVDDSPAGVSRRLSVGLEPNRLALLLAVLHRHAGISAHGQDVFVNAVSGVRISEPAADLAILMAVVSSLKNRPIPAGVVVFGEVGLGGEIRPVQRGQERLREAAKLGFSHALVPKANLPRQGVAGLQVLPVTSVEEALSTLANF